ncbi:MAG: autotransporter outer membrane beta-barrel domain-containing protein [Puniceicoccales bacterium]|jgi:hypothetical protein|nr:autotransporter outer membrane beta-barrel domain-containing protein [Puniceicoccales bacterium]
MKEESKKVGLLVNRYGLLAILGLGYSFLGMSACEATATTTPAATTPTAFPSDFNLKGITQDVRLIANFSGNPNAWIFDSNGALSAPGTVADIFRANESDTVKFLGAPEAGKVIQVIFDGSHLGSGSVADKVSDEIPLDVLNSLREEPDSIGPIYEALYNLSFNIGMAAASKEASAIATATQTKTAGASASGADNAIKEVFEDTIARVYDAENAAKANQSNSDDAGDLEEFWVNLADDTSSQESLRKAWGNIVKAAQANNNNDEIKFDDVGDSDLNKMTLGYTLGTALLKLINGKAVDDISYADLRGAIVAANGVYAADVKIDAIKNIIAKADEITKLLEPLEGKDKIMDLAQKAGTGNTAVKRIEDAKEVIEEAKKVSKEAWEKLGQLIDANSVFGQIKANSFRDYFNDGDTDVFKKALEDLFGNGKMKAPFVFAPVQASADAPNRTFVLQITQQGLSDTLDLTNKNGNLRSVVVDAENMRKDETFCIVFNSTNNQNVQPIRYGSISYLNLKTDTNLLLANNISETVLVDNIGALEPKDLYDHLTSQIIVNNKENVIKVASGDILYFKKLILGAPPPASLKLVKDNTLKESPVPIYYGNFNSESPLCVRDGIDVRSDSILKLTQITLDNATMDTSGFCFMGGDITIPENTTLTMSFLRISPLDFDDKIALNGTGDGKVGVFSVKGDLIFRKNDVINYKDPKPETFSSYDMAFDVVNEGNTSYHNYIVAEGGTLEEPLLINLNGTTLSLRDEDENGKRVLDKINTKDSSQLILVKKGSVVKINGGYREDGTASGTLNLDLHGDQAKRVALIRTEGGATVILDPVTLDAGSYTVLDAQPDDVFRVLDTDPVVLKGNINGSLVNFVFVLSDPDTPKAQSMLSWPSGASQQNARITLSYDFADFSLAQQGAKVAQAFLEAYKAKNPQIVFLDLKNNPNKATIKASLPDQINGPIKGITFKVDPDGNVVLDLSNVTVPSDLKGLLGGGVDTSHLSDSFHKLLNNIIANGARTQIEENIAAYVHSGLNDQEKSRILSAFCKTTTEEKNRMTLTLANSARETVYSKMGQEFLGDKHYSVWASGLGDITKNGSSSSYKMDCDIYGFTAGIDWRASNNLLIGAFGGYGKAKAKYKGAMQLHDKNPDGSDKASKCDLESYFGGIYGMWDEFIQDICVKFSLMAGHGKYKDHYALPRLDAIAYQSINSTPKGHWISGNIDCTYKHWNLYGVNIGPWVSLSAATVHQKADAVSINESAVVVGQNRFPSHFWRKVDAADRRSIETTIGVAADYDFSAGVLELALGYKHEFRRLKDGNVSFCEIYDDGSGTVARGAYAEYLKFDTFNVKTGKDSFVAKAAWNMKFGDFGLSVGGHTQLGNHFRDIAGSITASYSF